MEFIPTVAQLQNPSFSSEALGSLTCGKTEDLVQLLATCVHDFHAEFSFLFAFPFPTISKNGVHDRSDCTAS